MRIIHLLLAAFALSAELGQAQSSPALPPELAAHATSNECTPIANFYDAPGRTSPPYVFGFRSAGDRRSGVYWCEPGAEGFKTKLVLWYGEELRLTPPCAPLDWINPAAGLSLTHDDGPLISFYPVSVARLRAIRDGGGDMNPIEPLQNLTPTLPVVVSEYDGRVEEFYCHEGVWLVRQRH